MRHVLKIAVLLLHLMAVVFAQQGYAQTKSEQLLIDKGLSELREYHPVFSDIFEIFPDFEKIARSAMLDLLKSGQLNSQNARDLAMLHAKKQMQPQLSRHMSVAPNAAVVRVTHALNRNINRVKKDPQACLAYLKFGMVGVQKYFDREELFENLAVTIDTIKEAKSNPQPLAEYNIEKAVGYMEEAYIRENIPVDEFYLRFEIDPLQASVSEAVYLCRIHTQFHHILASMDEEKMAYFVKVLNFHSG